MDKPQPLNEKEIETVLQRLPGWTLEGTKLAKQFKFKDFLASLNFVNRLAPFFEEKDHHPDVQISYSRVTFELTTHDAGDRITNKDVEAATRIEQEYSAPT